MARQRVKYDNGICAHAPSKVKYHLRKKFSWFAGCAGIDDFNGKQCLKTDTLTFKVYVSLAAPADKADMELIHTIKVSGNEACKPFCLGVKDVSVLLLGAVGAGGVGACKGAP